MPLDLKQLIAQRHADKFGLHSQHLNTQFVNVLSVIGFKNNYKYAEGPYLYGEDGTRHLDLLSGYGVFALGRNHPVVADALRQALDLRLPNLVQMDVSLLAGLLAERLLPLLPGMEKIFFCNSGTEAVEGAIKFCRAATGREKIVHCSHAFHGLTMGSLSLNGDDIFRKGFGPLLPGCQEVPFNDLPALEAALKGKDVAAFIVEPIQGKGVNLPSDDYLPEVARLCRKYGTLFVADEIQTGVGRTGRFLALEHWGVEPDLVLLAKALSGGYVPVGVIASKKWVFDKLFDRMDRAVVHGSTFAKNDLAMAAGLATLTVLEDEKLIANAAKLGAEILADLQAFVDKYEFVKEVRGKGMMIGIEFGPARSFSLRTAWNLLESANRGLFCQMVTIPLFQRHRILCQVAGHGLYVIKLIPPLCLGQDDRTWIRAAFDDVIGDCHRVPGAVWDLAKSLAGSALKVKAGIG